jgi:hypothetical protein
VLNAYLGSKNRWFSLSLLLVISCAAIGRSPQEMMAQDGQQWPREIAAGDLKIMIYEPQLESFKGDLLRARSAFSVVKQDDAEPVFGALWFDATLHIDAGTRTAATRKIYVGQIRFPNADAAEVAALRQAVEADVSKWNLSYSIDALYAEIKAVEDRKLAAQQLKADVPKIIFRDHAAVLLTIEGEPSWQILDGTPYRRVTNSSFFLVQDSQSGKCYLHIPPFWWSADAALGPWQAVDGAPGAIEALWAREPKPSLPPSEPGQEATARPEVIPVTEPSELIWTDGPAQFAPIEGTNLLYVKNTESDVFLEIESQMTYVLLSGRWYRTPHNRTEWVFVPSDRLPADFSRIPLSSEKHHVLACVAGTAQARAAVLDADIPKTEAVKPGPAPELAATYDGSPQFAPISGAPVEYAVNTPYSIFCVNRRYYWCNEGIWYDSDLAVGPWYVCSWVPPAIYLIPPSCPYYYVTYCRIFSSTPRAIYVGYYPGYRGCYAWGGSIVYGTGWRYRCWSGSSWYARPVTWGVGVRYSSFNSTWTYRYGGGGTCAWTGLRRPSTWRAPAVCVDAGGRWAGSGYRAGSVGVYRTASVAPTMISSSRPDSLYVRQPERLVRPVAPEPRRADATPRGNPVPPNRGDRPAPVTPRPESPRSSPVPPRHDDQDPPRTPPSRENPRTPTPPRREDRESPRTPPPAPPSRDNRETPRTPPPAPPHREDRESPRTPPPAPPQRDNRESPRTPPPAPPHREDRESPRTPPPAPPQRDNRESPRTPPPAPPHREDRESPRTPPPAPPQRDNREAPRTPPPPPREDRESPRTPPPQRDNREAPRTPPPPPREHREAPRNPPPPPPPPPREHREAPRNPPPPPPPAERREPPRNPPPERREAPRDPPRGQDRRR